MAAHESASAEDNTKSTDTSDRLKPLKVSTSGLGTVAVKPGSQNNPGHNSNHSSGSETEGDGEIWQNLSLPSLGFSPSSPRLSPGRRLPRRYGCTISRHKGLLHARRTTTSKNTGGTSDPISLAVNGGEFGDIPALRDRIEQGNRQKSISPCFDSESSDSKQAADINSINKLKQVFPSILPFPLSSDLGHDSSSDSPSKVYCCVLPLSPAQQVGPSSVSYAQDDIFLSGVRLSASVTSRREKDKDELGNSQDNEALLNSARKMLCLPLSQKPDSGTCEKRNSEEVSKKSKIEAAPSDNAHITAIKKKNGTKRKMQQEEEVIINVGEKGAVTVVNSTVDINVLTEPMIQKLAEDLVTPLLDPTKSRLSKINIPPFTIKNFFNDSPSPSIDAASSTKSQCAISPAPPVNKMAEANGPASGKTKSSTTSTPSNNNATNGTPNKSRNSTEQRNESSNPTPLKVRSTHRPFPATSFSSFVNKSAPSSSGSLIPAPTLQEVFEKVRHLNFKTPPPASTSTAPTPSTSDDFLFGDGVGVEQSKNYFLLLAKLNLQRSLADEVKAPLRNYIRVHKLGRSACRTRVPQPLPGSTLADAHRYVATILLSSYNKFLKQAESHKEPLNELLKPFNMRWDEFCSSLFYHEVYQDSTVMDVIDNHFIDHLQPSLGDKEEEQLFLCFVNLIMQMRLATDKWRQLASMFEEMELQLAKQHTQLSEAVDCTKISVSRAPNPTPVEISASNATVSTPSSSSSSNIPTKVSDSSKSKVSSSNNKSENTDTKTARDLLLADVPCKCTEIFAQVDRQKKKHPRSSSNTTTATASSTSTTSTDSVSEQQLVCHCDACGLRFATSCLRCYPLHKPRCYLAAKSPSKSKETPAPPPSVTPTKSTNVNKKATTSTTTTTTNGSVPKTDKLLEVSKSTTGAKKESVPNKSKVAAAATTIASSSPSTSSVKSKDTKVTVPVSLPAPATSQDPSDGTVAVVAVREDAELLPVKPTTTTSEPTLPEASVPTATECGDGEETSHSHTPLHQRVCECCCYELFGPSGAQIVGMGKGSSQYRKEQMRAKLKTKLEQRKQGKDGPCAAGCMHHHCSEEGKLNDFGDSDEIPPTTTTEVWSVPSSDSNNHACVNSLSGLDTSATSSTTTLSGPPVVTSSSKKANKSRKKRSSPTATPSPAQPTPAQPTHSNTKTSSKVSATPQTAQKGTNNNSAKEQGKGKATKSTVEEAGTNSQTKKSTGAVQQNGEPQLYFDIRGRIEWTGMEAELANSHTDDLINELRTIPDKIYNCLQPHLDSSSSSLPPNPLPPLESSNSRRASATSLTSTTSSSKSSRGGKVKGGGGNSATATSTQTPAALNPMLSNQFPPHNRLLLRKEAAKMAHLPLVQWKSVWASQLTS